MAWRRSEVRDGHLWDPDRFGLRCALFHMANTLDQYRDPHTLALDEESVVLALKLAELARYWLRQARPPLRRGAWRDAEVAVDHLRRRIEDITRLDHAGAAQRGREERRRSARRQQELDRLLTEAAALVTAAVQRYRSRFPKLQDLLDAVHEDVELQRALGFAPEPARLQRLFPELFRGQRGPARGSRGGKNSKGTLPP